MRGLDIEARGGARSDRAGPVRFKPVPRKAGSPDERGRAPDKPESRQPARSLPSTNRTLRQRPSRRKRTRDRIDFTQRKRQALDDVATYRVVSVRDLVEQRFGGNAFAARKGIDALKKEGLIHEHTVKVKSGKTFKVLAASKKGRSQAWGNRNNSDQRYWSGLGKTSDIRHDATVYRAARSEIAKLEKSGASVKRIQLDHEMKARVSKIAEKARAKDGKEAALLAKIEAAKQMNLPVDDEGKVHYPDARIEYEDERGGAGRVDVEVTSGNYRTEGLQAKLSAGFKMYAGGGGAQRQLSSALGMREPRGGSRGGGGANRDEELFEL
ncbi:MAG: hypothetical protein OXL36_08990 [Bryobacterales bacterium]|nr:hypothetical protein [Bryobacterales bacterium]MDE0293026.1 hypothetical protein [Bryobacterales bacterium]